ncbi:hypothetical protein LMG26690_02423 [Achromobacter animicus]|uniref:Uncharacterized protein n=1 Tax=Achromobacter animicus TaxID=1389935 RepID=A0A6S6ZTY1_9BURK|nr:hypothetical protein [Achromobacter animicus]CAB3697033.1 hypothetical protein LMG26690_02423 [Achromobacter animicus]
MSSTKNDHGNSFVDEIGYSRLIIVETDEVVAAARKRLYSSLSELASKSPATLGKAALGFLYPQSLIMKGQRSAAFTFIDSWKAGRTDDLNLKPINAAEARALQMPPGHPILRTVYAAHPCVNTRFYPVASFHLSVFQDKVAEAHRLLSSLGATDITIEHVHGWDQNFNVNATGRFNGVDVGAEAGRASTSASNVHFASTFNGDIPPSLPEKLHWYQHEQLWQEVAEGRLKRGMRSFSMAISYHEDHNINARLKVKLEKAGLEIGGTFCEHVATTWKMTGTFKDQKPA